MQIKKDYTFKDALGGMKVMYEHASGYRKELVWIFILVLFSGALQAIQPFVFGKIVDSIVSPGTIPFSTLELIIAFGCIVLGVSFIGNIQGRIDTSTNESMRLSYLHKAYSHLLRLPLSFHKTHRSGELNEKINRGVQAIPQFWSEYVFNILPQLTYIGFSIFIIFTISHKVGWLLFGTSLIYSLISLNYVQPFARIQRAMQESYMKAGGIASDTIFNVRMVKEAASEVHASQKMHDAWFKGSLPLREELMTKTRNLSLSQSVIANTSRVVTLWIAYTLFRDGMITIGLFSALASYTSGFFSPLQQLFRLWRSIQNSLIAIEKADLLMKETPEHYVGQTIEHLQGEIVFDKVSFGYDQQTPVLKELSFTIKAGEVVAFVGESGVGKSSLIDLISAYYIPDSGTVSIDGMSTRDIDLTSLRSSVAVVSQEITLFNDTILNNIRYGKAQATDEEVKKAAVMAKCDFIERLPQTWNQMVGERGMKLSVGQKQRVAIARAFLRNPKILVLDEPTSALDAASERHIVSSLDEIMRDRTTLIIAHRLSTIRKADKILVFKQGELIEQGTHDELVAKAGEYKKLHDLQNYHA